MNIRVLPPSELESEYDPAKMPELPLDLTVNVEEETDDARIGPLNVAVILGFVTGTPLAPSTGLVLVTIGADAGCVIKSPSTLVSEMLAQSLRVFPFTVTLTYRPVVSGKS